jgi:pregnancy-associated plasma protein-A/type IX secretion system substrate protein
MFIKRLNRQQNGLAFFQYQVMLKKRIALLLFYYFTGCLLAYAQTQRICTTPEYDKYLRSADPAYARQRDEMESKIASYQTQQEAQRNSAATLIIPVVVHIVWNTPDQNLSDEQIISQIDVLNEDYSITNANIVEVPSVWANLVGSSHVYFSLARRNENNSDTTGIIRTYTNSPSFNTGDKMKHSATGGSNAWNRDHFLNIWVCNLQNSQGTQDILGYAQYPGGTDPSIDGIVINYQAFGRTGSNLKPQYNLGRTATHEIGHWLNLSHIWGDDDGKCISNGGSDDNIADTPDQSNATFGCPSYPQVSCDNSPDGDMFMNYMDYTDDKCMMLFTTDQRSRMNIAVSMYRDSLNYSADYALPVNTPAIDLKISNIKADTNGLENVVCERHINPNITIQNAGTGTVTSFSLKYGVDDDSLQQFDWSGSLLPGNSVVAALPQILISEDLHTFIGKIVSVNGGNDDYPLDNFATRGFIYAPAKYGCIEYSETPEIIILHNLAHHAISIETKYREAQKATLSIYNILGKKMYSADYLNSNGEFLNVDVSGLAAGIYFAEVKTFNKQVAGKFVVYHPAK